MKNPVHSKKGFRRPSVPVLLSLIAGILSGVHVPNQHLLPWLVGTAVTCLMILPFHDVRKIGFAILFFFFFSFGYLSIHPLIAPCFPSNHITRFANGRRAVLRGTVVETWKRQQGKKYAIVQTESFGNKRMPVNGRVRLITDANSPDFMQGDKIRFFGRLRRPRNFANPGGFDYERYLALQNIWVVSHANGESVIIEKQEPGNSLRNRIEMFRKRVSEFLDRIPGQNTGVLKALTVGKREDIPRSDREAFIRTGSAHILAISGLHIGIVAGGCFLVFRWALSFLPPLLWMAWVKKAAALLTVVPVILYGEISGMSPSTMRAVIMVLVFLLTFPLEKDHDPLNALVLAALIILIIDPSALFAVSFQLSMTAVYVILMGFPLLRKMLHRFYEKRSNLMDKVITLMIVTFLATLGTLPITMKTFHQFSLIGFMANLIVVPTIGFIVTPISLFGTFILPVYSKISFAVFSICLYILDPIVGILRGLSMLPYASVKTVTPSIIEIFLVYLTLAAAYLWIKEFVDRDLTNRFLTKKRLVLITAMLWVAGAADATFWVYQRFFRNDVRVTMVDVGQGASLLVELPSGFNVLVDGGGFHDNSVFDVGEKIIAPFLWNRKIRTIDMVILSHSHSDHINGLFYIIEHFHVKKLICPGNEASIPLFRKLLKRCSEKNVKVEFPGPENRKFFINGTVFRILHPFQSSSDCISSNNRRDTNNNSLVFQIRFGDISFLFTGDIMAEAEEALLKRNRSGLLSTVLFVPHHGSRTSSTPSFLDAVSPEAAIISCGWKNRFHYPHQGVLKAMKKRGIKVYRSDLSGAITLCTDGHALGIRPYRSGDTK